MRMVVFVVVTSYSPQKVRMEDGGERLRTLNCPVRIPAELRSWNRREHHFLHLRTTRSLRIWNRGRFRTRIRRSGNPGWHQTRSTTKRRVSWNLRIGRENRFQSVYRNGVRFVSNLYNKIFLRPS